MSDKTGIIDKATPETEGTVVVVFAKDGGYTTIGTLELGSEPEFVTLIETDGHGRRWITNMMTGDNPHRSEERNAAGEWVTLPELSLEEMSAKVDAMHQAEQETP